MKEIMLSSSCHFESIRSSGRRLIAFLQDFPDFVDLASELQTFVSKMNRDLFKQSFRLCFEAIECACNRLNQLMEIEIDKHDHLIIPFQSRANDGRIAFDDLLSNSIWNWKQLRAVVQLIRLMMSEVLTVTLLLISVTYSQSGS